MVRNERKSTKLVKSSMGCPNCGSRGKILATPAAWEKPVTSSEILFLREKPIWIQTPVDITALTNRVNQESYFHVEAGGRGLEFLEREGGLLLPKAGEMGEGGFETKKTGEEMKMRRGISHTFVLKHTDGIFRVS